MQRATHTETHLNDQIYHLRQQMQRLERKNMELERALQRAGAEGADAGSPTLPRPRTPKRKAQLTLQPAANGEELPAEGEAGGAVHYRRQAAAAQDRLRETQVQAKTLQTELDYSRRELERTQRRNESLKLRVGVLTSQVDQNARGHETFKQLEADLEHKGGLIVQAEAAITLLADERRELSGEIQELETLLAERTREIQKLYDGREAYRAQMQHQIDTLVRENQALRLTSSSTNEEASRYVAEADAAVAQARKAAHAQAAEAVEAAAVIAEGNTARAVDTAKREAAKQIRALEEEQQAYRLKVEEREQKLADIHAQMAHGELQRTQSFQLSLEQQEAALTQRLAAEKAEHEAMRQRLEKDLENAREEVVVAQQSSQELADAAIAAAREDAASQEAAVAAKAAVAAEHHAQQMRALEEEQQAYRLKVEEREQKLADIHAQMAHGELQRTQSFQLSLEQQEAALTQRLAAEKAEHEAMRQRLEKDLENAREEVVVAQQSSQELADAAIAAAREDAASQEAAVTDEGIGADDAAEQSDDDDFELHDGAETDKDAALRSVSQGSLDSASAPPPSPAPLQAVAAAGSVPVSNEMPVPTTSTVEFLALESAASADAEAAAAAQTTGSASAGADSAALPAGWSTAVSNSTGLTYFVNDYTNATTYDRPTEPALPDEDGEDFDPMEAEDEAVGADSSQAAELTEQDAGSAALGGTDSAALPAGWSTAVSNSTGLTYFVNDYTNATTYDRPTEPALPDEDGEDFDPMEAENEAVGADSSQAAELTEQDASSAALGGTDSAALPAGWSTAVSNSTGLTYFVNDYTNATTYDRPTEPALPDEDGEDFDPMEAENEAVGADSSQAAELTEQDASSAALGGTDSAALPAGWSTAVSNSTGLTYFVNDYTNATTYDRPTEPALPDEDGEDFDPMEAENEAVGADSSQAAELTEQDASSAALGGTDSAALPAGWSTAVSNSTGLTYFVNDYTNATTYDRPTEPAVGSAGLMDLAVADAAASAGSVGATQPPLDLTVGDADDQRGESAPGVKMVTTKAEEAAILQELSELDQKGTARSSPPPAESDTRGKNNSGKPSKAKKKKKKKGNGFFTCGTPKADSSRRKQLIEPPETQPPPESELERNPTVVGRSEKAPELPAWPSTSSAVDTRAPVAAPESDVAESSQQALSNSGPPRGWVKQKSRSTGQTYYWNPSTGVTTYDLPDKPGMTEEEWRDYLEEEAANSLQPR